MTDTDYTSRLEDLIIERDNTIAVLRARVAGLEAFFLGSAKRGGLAELADRMIRLEAERDAAVAQSKFWHDTADERSMGIKKEMARAEKAEAEADKLKKFLRKQK